MRHCPSPGDPEPASCTWVAAAPREALFALGRFALTESRRSGLSPNLLMPPVRDGIAERFACFAEKEIDLPGTRFLHDAVTYGTEALGFVPDPWVFELVQGVLGDASPAPGRMPVHCEQVVHAFFVERLCGGSPPPGRFDMFACAGGGMALDQVTQTLLANRLLAPQDRVAVAGSVLLPSVEFPTLGAYGFDVVDIVADPADDWQFPDHQIDKLADPTVKAFFLVNPQGPDLRAIRRRTIDRIESIVRSERPDLVIVADEGFGTFVDGFRSLAATLPASALSVYSFARHFGSPGWQLAIVALHQDNGLDCVIAEFPDEVSAEVSGRYAGLDGDQLKFVDRMVAESRSPAIRGGGGLSLPQQTQMSLFALFLLNAAGEDFVDATVSLVAGRLVGLRRDLGMTLTEPSALSGVPYYAVVDVLDLARNRHGEDFAAWLRRRRRPPDFATAVTTAAALRLPGSSDPLGWTIRLSLADSSTEDYTGIGARINSLLDELHGAYRGRRRGHRAEQARPRRGPAITPSG